jgi:hypothetical protein
MKDIILTQAQRDYLRPHMEQFNGAFASDVVTPLHRAMNWAQPTPVIVAFSDLGSRERIRLWTHRSAMRLAEDRQLFNAY